MLSGPRRGMSSFTLTKVPHGFHNSISACITSLKPAVECTLHAVFNLSSSIFVDAYELSQQNGYQIHLSKQMNLELPSRALHNETTSVLLDIDVTRSIDQTSLCVDVPLHYRYADPVDVGPSAYRLVGMDDPVAFWACPKLGTSFPAMYNIYTTLTVTQTIIQIPYLAQRALARLCLLSNNLR